MFQEKEYPQSVGPGIKQEAAFIALTDGAENPKSERAMIMSRTNTIFKSKSHGYFSA